MSERPAKNEFEDRKEAENVEVEWADDTRLHMQPSQLSYLDADDKQTAKPGSEALPLAIPSDSNRDCLDALALSWAPRPSLVRSFKPRRLPPISEGSYLAGSFEPWSTVSTLCSFALVITCLCIY
jgi:hypothetical protein